MNTYISFNTPELKKNHYKVTPDRPIHYDLSDVSMKKISSLQNDKGFVVGIHVPPYFQQALLSVDEKSLLSLISNNDTWFDNNLSEADIRKMFIAAFCCQNNMIKCVITHQTNIIKNGKDCEIPDMMNIISETPYSNRYMINMRLQYAGLHIYPKYTMNRWIVKQVNIYENEEMIGEKREDIEEFWGNQVKECQDLLDNRIKSIGMTKKNMDKILDDIKKCEYSNKNWESKISDLKNLVQNIIF